MLCYVFHVLLNVLVRLLVDCGEELDLGLHMGSLWTLVFSVLSHLLVLSSQMR